MSHGSPRVQASRRALLAGAGVVAATALTGCDVRLQRSAPRVPGLTTQGPPPDSDVLTATLDRLRMLAAAAHRAAAAPTTGSTRTTTPAPADAGSPPPRTGKQWAADLAAIHDRQARRLQQIIASAGVSVTSSTSAGARHGGSSPGGAAHAETPPVTASGTVRALRSLEQHGIRPAVLRSMAGATRTDLPMLCCLGAVQAAAATVLGAEVGWQAGDSVTAKGAAALLLQVDACVYALEQIAGETPPPHRTLIAGTLTTMYAARGRLVTAAGAAAPAPHVDYRLPVVTTDAASRGRLARVMLGRVVTGCASRCPETTGHAPRVGAIVRLWSEALAASWQWGTPLEPFPGLLST